MKNPHSFSLARPTILLMLVSAICFGIIVTDLRLINHAHAQRGSSSGGGGGSHSGGGGSSRSGGGGGDRSGGGGRSDGGGRSGDRRQSKTSEDVRRRLSRVSPEARMRIIVQPKDSWNDDLDSTLLTQGAQVNTAFENFQMRDIEITAKDIDSLAGRDDIAYVSLDREVRSLGHLSRTTGADAVSKLAPANSRFDGTGIGIAIIDSGIDTDHPALAKRVVASQDFTGEKDQNGRRLTSDYFGHGTYVAAIAAGSAEADSGAYQGIAPKAHLINLRVLNKKGQGTTANLLRALDWVLANHRNSLYNIRVVNLSLGTESVESYENDPLCRAIRRVVNSGIVVAVAAGNNGHTGKGQKVYGQIHSPGNEPSAMTVGASNTHGTDYRHDDTMTSYSSRGPTRSYWTDDSGMKHYDNLVKPDLTAPGNKIYLTKTSPSRFISRGSTWDVNANWSSHRERIEVNGTSIATPVAAGAAALLLQANPKLTPNMVKAILMYTAQQLPGFNQLEQGAGQINIEGAMRVAKLVRTDLNWSDMINGAAMLKSPLPANQATTIASSDFSWSRGIILNHTFAYGNELMTNFQKIYQRGILITDGAIDTQGESLIDSQQMSDGVQLSNNILVSTGETINEGQQFLATSALLSEGMVLSDGLLLADGVVMSDGLLIPDGVLISDKASKRGK